MLRKSKDKDVSIDKNNQQFENTEFTLISI